MAGVLLLLVGVLLGAEVTLLDFKICPILILAGFHLQDLPPQGSWLMNDLCSFMVENICYVGFSLKGHFGWLSYFYDTFSLNFANLDALASGAECYRGIFEAGLIFPLLVSKLLSFSPSAYLWSSAFTFGVQKP